MIDTPSLHDEAMRMADDGDLARRGGDHEAARASFVRAMEMEREAADAETTEPSRSILYRSASWLALEAEDPKEAERLAACGLAGRGVPERVKAELRAVFEEARMRLTRLLRPPSAVSSLTIHVEGPEIGFGLASPLDVDGRRDAAKAMVYRTAERREHRPFRRIGPPSRVLARQVDPRVRYADGSVVVQVLLGGSQPELWDTNAAIVEEVQRCLRAFCEGGADALRPLITDDTYRENFALLASQLAPDGTRVTAVDVHAATSRSALPVVRLRKPGRETKSAKPVPVEPATEVLVGELRGVDETRTKAKNTIKLRLLDPAGSIVAIGVGDAAMEDIVRPLYGRVVEVAVQRRGGRRTLSGAPRAVEP